MSTYFLNTTSIHRNSKRGLLAYHINYITGLPVQSQRTRKEYNNLRDDVIFKEILLPASAPPEFHNIQFFCDAVENSEHRKDARLARYIKAALPNELPTDEQIRIARHFFLSNFVRIGFGTILAIHRGMNKEILSNSNPHLHALVSLRTIDSKGLSPKKDRELNKDCYVFVWRKVWADTQNKAYERNGLDIRVDHRSLKARGIDREPLPRLSYTDWKREQNGELTLAGDQRRAIESRNADREQQRQLNREYERDLSR